MTTIIHHEPVNMSVRIPIRLTARPVAQVPETPRERRRRTLCLVLCYLLVAGAAALTGSYIATEPSAEFLR